MAAKKLEKQTKVGKKEFVEAYNALDFELPYNPFNEVPFHATAITKGSSPKFNSRSKGFR